MSADRITLSVTTLALLGALPMLRRRRRARAVRVTPTTHPILVIERERALRGRR